MHGCAHQRTGIRWTAARRRMCRRQCRRCCCWTGPCRAMSGQLCLVDHTNKICRFGASNMSPLSFVMLLLPRYSSVKLLRLANMSDANLEILLLVKLLLVMISTSSYPPNCASKHALNSWRREEKVSRHRRDAVEERVTAKRVIDCLDQIVRAHNDSSDVVSRSRLMSREESSLLATFLRNSFEVGH